MVTDGRPHCESNQGNCAPGSLTKAQDLDDNRLLAHIIGLTANESDGHDIASSLFNHFGSLTEILKADVFSISRIVKDQDVVSFIDLMQSIFARVLYNELPKRSIIDNQKELYDYLHVTMDSLIVEQVWIIFLNKANIIIKYEKISTGTIDSAPIYPREIIRRSLELGASSIVIAHNHPSGLAEPSIQDISATRTIIEAGRIFGIYVLDHVIIGREGHFSLRSQGFI
jgi:DNA repair protein RadC